MLCQRDTLFPFHRGQSSGSFVLAILPYHGTSDKFRFSVDSGRRESKGTKTVARNAQHSLEGSDFKRDSGNPGETSFVFSDRNLNIIR